MRMRNSLLISSVVTLSLMGACEDKKGGSSKDPVPVEQARARATQSTDHTLAALDHAYTFLSSLQAVDAMLSLSLGGSDVEVSEDTEVDEIRARMRQKIKNSPSMATLGKAARRLALRFDPRAETPQHRRALREQGSSEIDEMRNEIREFLAERIFIDENIEEVDGDTTIYRLPGEVLCTYGSVSPEVSDDGEEVDDFGDSTDEEVDSECVAQIEAIEVRLAVQALGDDGITVDLLIGSDRHQPLSVDLEPQRIAQTVDLAEVLKSWKVVAKVVDAEMEFPQEMSGKETCEVTTPSDQVFNGSCSVLETIDIVGPDEEGEATPTEIHVASADPLVWISVDAKSKALDGGLAVGAVDVSYADTSGLDGQYHPVELHVDGLAAETMVHEGDTELMFTGVGLGDESSYLDYAGERVVTVDLNREHGRAFDLTVIPDEASESAALRFGGAVTLAIDVNEEAAILPDFVNDSDWHSITVALDGDAAPEILPYTDEEGYTATKVVRGHLRLSDAKASVDVEAGSCLLDNPDDASSDPTSPVSSFVAGTCPAVP